jgi:hypothetical protein
MLYYSKLGIIGQPKELYALQAHVTLAQDAIEVFYHNDFANLVLDLEWLIRLNQVFHSASYNTAGQHSAGIGPQAHVDTFDSLAF